MALRRSMWVAFAVFAALLLAAAGCRRACATRDNCKRSCSCLNAQTNARADCPVAFRCEANEGYCETDYDNMSCDELCGLYAANAKCGLERCLLDAECEKKLSCPIRNADGSDSGQFYECTLPFACTAVSEALDDGSAGVPRVCDENSTLADTQLCAICDLAAGQSG